MHTEMFKSAAGHGPCGYGKRGNYLHVVFIMPAGKNVLIANFSAQIKSLAVDFRGSKHGKIRLYHSYDMNKAPITEITPDIYSADSE